MNTDFFDNLTPEQLEQLNIAFKDFSEADFNNATSLLSEVEGAFDFSEIPAVAAATPSTPSTSHHQQSTTAAMDLSDDDDVAARVEHRIEKVDEQFYDLFTAMEFPVPPLHKAIMEEDIFAIIRLLARPDTDVNAREMMNMRTPLMTAMLYQVDQSIISHLIARGADDFKTEARDLWGYTAVELGVAGSAMRRKLNKPEPHPSCGLNDPPTYSVDVITNMYADSAAAMAAIEQRVITLRCKQTRKRTPYSIPDVIYEIM
jgi:hypothetical protein